MIIGSGHLMHEQRMWHFCANVSMSMARAKTVNTFSTIGYIMSWLRLAAALTSVPVSPAGYV
jgi:hypothetical protein